MSRADAFDDLVRDSADRLERKWPQLAGVEFVVQEVPPAEGGADDGWTGGWVGGWGGPDGVPLGRYVPARDGRPARVVVYRRPIELRSTTRDDRALLVHEVVVEQVAELLGLAPESVDPRYGQD